MFTAEGKLKKAMGGEVAPFESIIWLAFNFGGRGDASFQIKAEMLITQPMYICI